MDRFDQTIPLHPMGEAGCEGARPGRRGFVFFGWDGR